MQPDFHIDRNGKHFATNEKRNLETIFWVATTVFIGFGLGAGLALIGALKAAGPLIGAP